MSGINNNRVNSVMTGEQIAYVKSLFTSIQDQLPFLIGLSSAERVNMPKINVSNKAFTEDAFNVLSNNPAMFPPFMAADVLQRDLTLFAQLDEIYTICRQLAEKIDDTRLVAGSEAYTTALSVYRITEAASVVGMPGSKAIYQQLKARFSYSPAAAEAATPTPEEGAPTEN